MKKIALILPALFLFAGIALAQQATTVSEKVEGPAMSFEKEIIDYGTIEQSSDPYRTFSFVNNGNEPLIIKQAKGSCGCTVPTYPEKPVMPGETAEIKVRYDTKRLGKFRKTVTLVTNAKPATKVLTIFGEVKKPAPEPQGVPVNNNSPFKNN